MEFLSYLANVAARSLCLAAAALLTIWLLRVKSAAGRHAIWTMVVFGMLLLLPLTPLLPRISAPVLSAGTPQPVEFVMPPTPAGTGHQPAMAAPVQSRADWPQVLYFAGMLILLARLAYGYWLTRRLIRASRRFADIWESDRIVTPMTVGWLRPRILLPAGWAAWEPSILDGVLAHERAHIGRADWAIRVVAAFNRCVFWFHPLSWWLERRLTVLSEQACDDAAVLAMGARDRYAQTLLDFAAAVRNSRGRLNWEAVAMTRRSAVIDRVERILDDRRPLSRELTPRRWAAVAACGLAAAYLAAALHFTAKPALAETRTHIELSKAQLRPEVVNGLELAVAVNPDDVAARSSLIAHYLVTGANEPRARHVLWMINRHPEADILQTPTLFNTPGPLEDTQAFAQAAALWRQQAPLHANDPRVVVNAARFFWFARDDFYETERWLKRARDVEPSNRAWPSQLAQIYSSAILAGAGWPGLPAAWADPGIAAHARAELDLLADGQPVWEAGKALEVSSRRAPDPTQFAELAEYGRALQKRAQEDLGYRPPDIEALMARLRAAAPPVEPEPVRRVDPVYPPLARQARIHGIVRFNILIGTDGAVQRIDLVSGHPLLVDAARAAVSQWQYPPQAMPAMVQIGVSFKPVADALDGDPARRQFIR